MRCILINRFICLSPKPFFRINGAALGLAICAQCVPMIGATQPVLTAPPLAAPSSSAYQQRLPDGRIAYSDKPSAHAKPVQADVPPHHAPLAPMIEKSDPDRVPPHASTPIEIKRVLSLPRDGRQKTVEELDADVLRAEMFLEDARNARDRAETQPDDAARAIRNAHAPSDLALNKRVTDAEAQLRQARKAQRIRSFNP